LLQLLKLGLIAQVIQGGVDSKSHYPARMFIGSLPQEFDGFGTLPQCNVKQGEVPR
jgi:hypothetical protein